ncbi:MAG: EAL domain-containing protein [Clostridia bacterium]
MKLNKLFRVLSLVLIAILVATSFPLQFFSVYALPSGKFKERKPLRVGFFEFDGYHNVSTDDKGNISRSGYGYEYLQELAKITGWNYDYIDTNSKKEPLSWKDAQQMLIDGEIDILTSAQYNAERDKIFDYPDQDMGQSYIILTVKKGETHYTYNGFEEFNGMNIGFLNNNSRNAQFEKFAEEKGFTYNEKFFDEQSKLSQALEDGEVDAILTSNLRRLADYEKVIAKFNHSPFYAVVKQGNNDLLDDLNRGLEELATRSPFLNATLYQKYYGNNSGAGIALTFEEEEYLQQNPIIKAVAIGKQKPLSYFENGEYKGILADILKQIAKELDIEFAFTEVATAEDCYAMLNAGEAEFISNFASDFSWAEQNNIRITSPLLDLKYSAVTSNKNHNEKRTVATPRDQYLTLVFLDKIYPIENILLYDNVQDCIDAVKQGDADIVYLDTFSANEVSKHASNGMTAFFTNSINHGVSLGIRKDNPMLQIILDKEILSLSEMYINQIVTQHTMFKIDRYDFAELIYQNPFEFAMFLIVLFLIVVGILIYIIIMRKKLHKHIYNLAYIDELTGLWNSHKFEEEIPKLLQYAKDDLNYAIVSMDIKRFALINENYGRYIGDKIIKYVAKAVSELEINGSKVSRNKADHFFILLKYNTIDDIRFVLANLNQSLANYTDYNTDIRLKFNYGVYIYDDLEMPISSAIDFAELARREVKNSKEPIVFFDKNFEEQLKKEKRIEQAMENSLETNEFVVFYQPKFNMTTNKIMGAEALVRWNNKIYGFMSPADFIPTFEKNGFIIEVDFFVLEEVCKMLRKRLDEGKVCVPISVNQSRIHFQSANYIEHIQSVVDKYSIPSNLIELEITETVLVTAESTYNVSKILKGLGFRLSVDDFGSGYSSLTMLNAVKLDVLKIDRAFLSESQTSVRARIIIQKVIEMADKLDMEVICEGVETIQQVEFLISVGCNYGQGFLFARPMPLEEFTVLFDHSIKS